MVQETTGSEAIESSTKLPTEPTTSLIEKTDSTRDERAAELVDRLSLWSGAAGLIPVPLVDVAAVWGVQLHMLRRLSEVYGVPFSENRGKSILTSLAGAMSAATAATTMTSLMKGVPIIGTAIGALTMPAVAACGTWVIGKVFMKHFASGGTLLDFNPPDYREFIKVQKTKFGARARETAPASPPATAPAASDTAAESKTNHERLMAFVAGLSTPAAISAGRRDNRGSRVPTTRSSLDRIHRNDPSVPRPRAAMRGRRAI